MHLGALHSRIAVALRCGRCCPSFEPVREPEVTADDRGRFRSNAAHVRLSLSFCLGLDLLPFVFQPRPERGLGRLGAFADDLRGHSFDALDIDRSRLRLTALRGGRGPGDDRRLELIIDRQEFGAGPLRNRLREFGGKRGRYRSGRNEWNQQHR